MATLIDGVELDGVYWTNGKAIPAGVDPGDWQTLGPHMAPRFAAGALGVNPETVRRWAMRGYIRFYIPNAERGGTHHRYHAGDVADLVIKLRNHRRGIPLITRIPEQDRRHG